jgi:hypothetical protein
MTCLHCGKKLGFFSRYKDTPFCSEEHLRTHQDELEQALMERLGSKSAAPAKSLRDLAHDSPSPIQSMVGLETSLRAEEPKPLPRKELQPVIEFQVQEQPKPVVEAPKPQPLPEPPPAQPVAASPKPEPPPAPLQERYFSYTPSARAALNIQEPLIPPASFAIIVQADCCTPHLPDHMMSSGFDSDATEFELEITDFNTTESELELRTIEAFEEGDFGEPWVELPEINFEQTKPDFHFAEVESELDYEAGNTSPHYTAFGGRDEINPRIRPRFPYAASQVTSTLNSMPSYQEGLVFTESTDWEPVVPALHSSLKMKESEPPQVEQKPSVDVPLSISALLHFTLEGADREDFGETFSFEARPLAGHIPVTVDCAIEKWTSTTLLPAPATQKSFRPRWQTPRCSDRVPPVSFPSLFQLGSVLPPRPENLAG